MLHFFKCELDGNVVTEPVKRESQNGGYFYTFRFANEPIRPKEGHEKKTIFLDVHADQHYERLMESIHVGSALHIWGDLNTRSYENKEGITKTEIVVRINDVKFTSYPYKKKEDDGENNENGESEKSSTPHVEDNNDELFS